MKCTNCGNEVPETAKVCGYCGHRLKENTPSPAIQSMATKQGLPGWVWRVIGGLVVISGISVIAAMQLLKGNIPANLPPAITLTDTPSNPMASVSVDTNCRSGPSQSYDVLGVLLAGKTAEVVGKNIETNYWIIKNPESSGMCWLWGNYATVNGNVAALQEYAIPPTPTNVPPPTETSLPTVTVSPEPPASRVIYVVRDADGNSAIYTVNIDGSDITLLTNDGFSPEGSPDGKKIVFDSFRDGGQHIYVMDADGGNQTQLTENSSYDICPSWSPDGRQIAFVSGRNGNYEIYVINADGSGERRITHNPGNDECPLWSPDGKQLLFVSDRDGNYEIYVASVNGNGEMRLTNDSSNDGTPNWSPDGQQIAFVSNRDGNNEIYTMSSNGAGVTRLTNNTGSNFYPRWTPDGEKIVFSGRNGVEIINADGSNRTQYVVFGFPKWSADEEYIAFLDTHSDNYNLYDLYTANSDGRNQLLLAENVTYEFDWLP